MKPYAMLFVTLASLLWQHAFAADSLRATLEASKISQDPNGKEHYSVADAARPGDTIEYRATYQNVSKQPLRGVMAVLPVPAFGVEFLINSAQPAGVEASLDGVWFAPAPLKRLTKRPDGKPQQQLVPATEYRFLRWPIGDLAPGASKSVSARARVVSGPVLTTR